jgi:hypothetical protein
VGAREIDAEEEEEEEKEEESNPSFNLLSLPHLILHFTK